MTDVDPDADIRKRLEDTKKMVALRKERYAVALGQADPPPEAGLATIHKLEVQIANMEQYLRLRAAFRRLKAGQKKQPEPEES